MACGVCRSRCAEGRFSGTSFMLQLHDGDVDSLILPCNIRDEFNELVGSNVDFNVHGTTYILRVKKERTKTYFCGQALQALIATYNLSGGDYIHFSMDGPQPRIKIVYMGGIASEHGGSEEETENTEDMDTEDDMDEEDPWKHVVVAQRANLSEIEKDRVLQKLAEIDSYIGFPFVHRITNTNISNGHVMKIPMAVADSAGMEPGTIGVRRGESGHVTAVPITRDNADGRVILNSQAWRQFHSARVGMAVGRAILITMRNSDVPNLDMMMVIHYISPLEL